MRLHFFFESLLHSVNFFFHILNCKLRLDRARRKDFAVSTFTVSCRKIITVESVVKGSCKLLHLHTQLIELLLTIVAHLPLIFLQKVRILLILLGLIGQLKADHFSDLLFKSFARVSQLAPNSDFGGSTWLVST